MSHEIRTPLNAVLGMDEMIMREDDIDEIHSHAASIMHAGKSLLSIIDDILDFTKIESGMMHIITNDYRVSEEIRELYNIVTFRAKKKGLDLYFDIDPNIPKILHGDEIRIRQILINIINNAVKYTKSGWVKVSLKAEFTDDSNMVLIGTVEDTGIGIKKEDITKLFDKFQRLDESINHKVEGTGLGLSIVYNLLQMMNGSINVQSVYQRGSLYTVKIPQAIVDKTPIGTVDLTYSTVTSNYKESFTAPDAKLLVVDDNQINLTIVKGLLKKTLMNIDLASSGRECLDMVTKNSYDMILLDHMMPEMDGLEVLAKLKVMDNNLSKDCPIIALTANAIVGAKEQYLSAGFDDYLSKPIDYNELESVIKKHLKMS
jgi:CheY-like chemotaxis protein